MFEVYKNTKHWEPLFLAAMDNGENVLGVLFCVLQKEFGGLLGRFTTRAIIWGGPLVNPVEQRTEAVNYLLKAVDKVLKDKSIYIQFRNLYDLSDSKDCFKNNGYLFEDHLDFICDLTIGEESLWKKLFPSRRNKIRKAEKEGLKIQLINNISEFEDSYYILKKIYSRIKLPLADKTLFDSAYRILSPKELLKVFLAKYNNKAIGALYLLTYGGKSYVWYAGSLSAYLNKHPNDILYWEAMKWSCRNNYKTFDFGGAGSPDKKYGVREFKRQFGADLVNYGRYRKVYKPRLFKLIKICLEACKI
jgi:lipid II:glycine glycyltransferase (peptidoglycan interpeptide bridge formation enzyme)